ncbi:MAG: DNA-directed RNA polymerase subunit delta [bacterium]|nr:DNA-directed RNA polymerase subunit delta [bacterium]
MSIKNLTNEDIDTLSYDELANLILQENKKQMKIIDIFKKICELKNMTEKDFEDKIADFYDLISTNKEFLVLEKGFCDLRKNHTPDVIIEDEDELDPEEIDEEIIDEDDISDDEEDIFYDNSSNEDDVDTDDDELSDFMVVDEEDETSI